MTDRAPMLAAARLGAPFKTGYYSCCKRHAPWGIRQGLKRRNRRRERDQWRKDEATHA